MAPGRVNFLNTLVALATVEIELTAGETAGRLLGSTLLELEAVRDAQQAVPLHLAAASFAMWRGDVADARRAAGRGWQLVGATEDWILAARTAATAVEVDAAAAIEAHERRDLAAWRPPESGPTPSSAPQRRSSVGTGSRRHSARAGSPMPGLPRPAPTDAVWTVAMTLRSGPPSPMAGRRWASRTNVPELAGGRPRLPWAAGRAGPVVAMLGVRCSRRSSWRSSSARCRCSGPSVSWRVGP